MTEHQRLFLVQARSDYMVFERFKGDPDIPACHALHYLQMATEKLGKAHAWKDGRAPARSHRSFEPFLRGLESNRQVQTLFGFKTRNNQWIQLIKSFVPFAERIQALAPGLNPHVDGPNPEYPWPHADPANAPVEYQFELWRELKQTNAGRKFLDYLGRLFKTADQFL